MKKYIIPLISFTYICIGCQSNYHKSCYSIDKAVIFYNAKEAPWGILRIATIDVQNYLRDSTNLAKIVIKDKNKLQFICDRLIHVDTIAFEHNIDTWIAALLYSSNKIDTLALDAYPQNDLQYNNLIFRDSILAYYLIDLIRSHSSIWNKQAMEFYYDGKYNPLSKSFWNKIPEGK